MNSECFFVRENTPRKPKILPINMIIICKKIMYLLVIKDSYGSHGLFIEGSLEVKLPTIWTVEKQR